MSWPVFVHPDLSGVSPGQTARLDGAEGRHAVTVKRIVAGERVIFSDGAGYRALISVTATEGKDQLVGVVETVEQVPEPNPRVVVIQAIPKSERAELAVDLATQAGADEIIAWQAERCVARWDEKKAPKAVAKWQAAAQAAAKQSRRPRVPRVSGPLTTAQVAALAGDTTTAGGTNVGTTAGGTSEASATTAVLVLHEEATLSLKEVPLAGVTQIYLIVGPEGGIGPDELAQLPATPVKLGPEVLRTAAAAMVALAGIGMRTARW